MDPISIKRAWREYYRMEDVISRADANGDDQLDYATEIEGNAGGLSPEDQQKLMDLDFALPTSENPLSPDTYKYYAKKGVLRLVAIDEWKGSSKPKLSPGNKDRFVSGEEIFNIKRVPKSKREGVDPVSKLDDLARFITLSSGQGR